MLFALILSLLTTISVYGLLREQIKLWNEHQAARAARDAAERRLRQ